MNGCLERTKQWLRLAFACLAIVGGGLPAQAVAEPRSEVAGAVLRVEAARSPQRRGQVALQPARACAPAARPGLCRTEARRRAWPQGPPRRVYLEQRALLR